MFARTVTHVGGLVREARQEQGLTQAELARQIGVSRDWVVRLEQGHPRPEAQLVLDALAGVRLAVSAEHSTEPQGPDEFDDLMQSLTDRRARD